MSCVNSPSSSRHIPGAIAILEKLGYGPFHNERISIGKMRIFLQTHHFGDLLGIDLRKWKAHQVELEEAAT
jgi:hypothetical protein